MEFVAILLILSAVVAYVTAPLRRNGRGGGQTADTDMPARAEQEARVAELEAAREAKYREIRDAELDHRTGKLSTADFEELDATLRAEAVEILNALARVQHGDASLEPR